MKTQTSMDLSAFTGLVTNRIRISAGTFIADIEHVSKYSQGQWWHNDPYELAYGTHKQATMKKPEYYKFTLASNRSLSDRPMVIKILADDCARTESRKENGKLYFECGPGVLRFHIKDEKSKLWLTLDFSQPKAGTYIVTSNANL